jgi:hypothetical protein
MRNPASSAFKRITTIARYICPNAWWAIPFSILVVGLVAHVVSSTLDSFNWDNYWLMVGVEKPFFEYVTTFGWGYAFTLHYWVSYRVFGDSLSGYLVLPLLSSLAALLVAYWGLRRYWRANLAICIVTMAILAFNAHSLFLAQYSMFTYANSLLVSACLFFLFMHLSISRLTRRQWIGVTACIIPGAFFSNLTILVPVAAGVLSVLILRCWRFKTLGRIYHEVTRSLVEMWPLGIFPLMQFALLISQRSLMYLAAFRPALDPYYFVSSQYHHNLLGAIQFLWSNTVDLFRSLLIPHPLSSTGAEKPAWIAVTVVIAVMIIALVVRFLQRRLDQRMGFVLVFSVVTLVAIAVGGLFGLYPYGEVRYAYYLLLPISVLLGYGVSSVLGLTTLRALIRWIRASRLVPVLLAIAILATGTVYNLQEYRSYSSTTAGNLAALQEIKNTKADMVLLSFFSAPVIAARCPDLYSSAYNMGWGESGVVRTDDAITEDIAEAIAGGDGSVNTILVITASEAELDRYFPSWSELLNAYFDYSSETEGPSLWGEYYTRKR